MMINTIPIGKLVSDELQRQGQSVQWMADQIGTSLQNCYKILHASSVSTDMLQRISTSLNHNFFADIAALMNQPGIELPEVEITPDFHQQFNAIMEPFLKRAGYKGRIKDGILIVWMGDPRIEVHHTDDYEYAEMVSLWYTLKDKRFNELQELGCVVLANELALEYPRWSIAYDYHKKVIQAKYNCCVFKPKDLVRYLDYSNYSYCDLYDHMQWLLPQVLKDFPKD